MKAILPDFGYYDFIFSPNGKPGHPNTVQSISRIGAVSPVMALLQYFHFNVLPWKLCGVVGVVRYQAVARNGRTVVRYREVERYEGDSLRKLYSRAFTMSEKIPVFVKRIE